MLTAIIRHTMVINLKESAASNTQ